MRWSNTMTHAPWLTKVVAAIVLAWLVAPICVIASPPAPSTPQAPPGHTQLSSSLAKLLRELDRHQTRRLSGATDRNAPQTFRRLGIPDLENQVGRAIEEGPVLVVVGVRGPRPNSAFEIDHAIRIDAVPGRPTGRQAVRLPNRRQAYERAGPVDSATTAEMAGLLAMPASASNPQVTPTAALGALSCRRCAAFIVAFSASAAGSASTITSLVLLPDSVKIDIVGSHAGLPEPEARGAQAGSPPPPAPTPPPPETEPGTEYPPFDPLLPSSPPYDPSVPSEPEF